MGLEPALPVAVAQRRGAGGEDEDRKSTRLNSSHSQISYAVFCLKKKKKITNCCTDQNKNINLRNSINQMNWNFMSYQCSIFSILILRPPLSNSYAIYIYTDTIYMVDHSCNMLPHITSQYNIFSVH